MIICKTIDSLQAVLKPLSKMNEGIGFVPTMGALHEGHLSLIGSSKKNSGTTVCSIFVNPTQFNDAKDFEKYPITIQNDIVLLEAAQCDVLFLPSVAEMYPEQLVTNHHYELGFIETVLEGSHRPGHFQGVCQVVQRLLAIVQPNEIFLGQKDYQQCMVIKKLTTLLGLDATNVIIGKTVRETSGLAMSSRNMRLSDADKQRATAIFTVLNYVQQNIQSGPLSYLLLNAQDQIGSAGFEKIDYVAICNASTLEPIANWDGKEKLVVLVAAFLSGVRLIDNMVIN
ncbi:MAG: pantoate--beta-alanine ligase [Chitinophagaceae bacterium]|nr:pantoate--beta-alanine ligase [Chitinophagaceae bacterium]